MNALTSEPSKDGQPRTEPMILPLSDAQDVSLVGGKAINLCRLIDAGLPVPNGFVITTAAYRDAGGKTEFPSSLADQIRNAYLQMGQPSVAVRSSATAEDLAEASLAGQYDTFLDINGADSVIASIQKCWRSLDNDRVQVYLREHGIDAGEVAVAVVVQQLVPAEVSGVLFTVDPHTGDANQMVIEAVYGLGEGIVSGEVQPDVFRLDRHSEQVLDIHIAKKSKALLPGKHEYQDVDNTRAAKACLNHAQLQQLRKIGLQIENHYGCPQDVEWAIVDNGVQVLQARPITSLVDTRAYHELLESTRTFLTKELAAERGPWVRHNLGETLPQPTPLTWSLIQSFMSGRGGFGLMHEHVGFSPADDVQEHGFLTLIGGQIFMDCSRLPQMFGEGYPFRYDLEELRNNPDAAQQPPTIPNGTFQQMSAAAQLGTDVTQKIRQRAEKLDFEFDSQFVPQVVAWCEAQTDQDLAAVSDEELVDRWHAQQETVLNDFGATAFLPSMVEGLAAAELKTFLSEYLWDDDPEELLRLLSVGATMDSTLQSNVDLQAVANGKRPLESWLTHYGFRGPGEFDLANPRWNERQDELKDLAAQLADSSDVAQRHHQRIQEAEQCLNRLTQQLDTGLATKLRSYVELLQRYVRFREDGKSIFIRAFGELRKTALEFGRRLKLADDLFYLHADELVTALKDGFVRQDRIVRRKQQRKASKQISLPHMIEAHDIDTLGEPTVAEHADHWPAFPVASGSCSGPARIVFDPTQTHDLGKGYILVCPSTDPAWTPLFINAAGLILERGGSLSHGAIVARELGLPAVVLENATSILEEGELLTINGNRGQIARSDSSSAELEKSQNTESADADDVFIGFAQRPPVAGTKEQRSNQLALLAALMWGVILAVMYLVPAPWIKDPTFGLIDRILWPLVAGVGMVWTVMLVGVFFGVVPLLIQRFGTDNRRLWVAKTRAAQLRKSAGKLPAESARRSAMLELASPLTMRTLKASMASLAWVLGPMMLVFLWMPDRMDPASWNAEPGGTVSVAADLNGEYLGPVTCSVASPLTLESMTPATQAIPPIRSTLEELRREWKSTKNLQDYPWQLQSAGEQTQQIMLGSLNGYLATRIPPQRLTWMIRVPNDATGHFPVTVSMENQEPCEIILAFGNQKPPTLKTVGGNNDPLIQLETTYPRPLQQRFFWRPLKLIGGPAWDFGWLGAYVLSYLVALIITKKILSVP